MASDDWKKKGKKKINAEDHKGKEGAEKEKDGREGRFFFLFYFQL